LYVYLATERLLLKLLLHLFYYSPIIAHLIQNSDHFILLHWKNGCTMFQKYAMSVGYFIHYVCCWQGWWSWRQFHQELTPFLFVTWLDCISALQLNNTVFCSCPRNARKTRTFLIFTGIQGIFIKHFSTCLTFLSHTFSPFFLWYKYIYPHEILSQLD